MAIFEDLYLCYQRYRKHFESNFYDDDFVFEKYIGTDHSVIKTYTCKSCRLITFDPQSHGCYLTAHKVTAYLCKRCGKMCTLEEFNRHLCPGILNLCIYCNKAFTTPLELMLHINSVHTKKEFKCKKCPNAYRSNHALRYHFDLKHLTPAFSCDVCFKVFGQLANLKRHKNRSHKARLTCEKCGASFKQRGRLEHHQRTFHTEVTMTLCILAMRPIAEKREPDRMLVTWTTLLYRTPKTSSLFCALANTTSRGLQLEINAHFYSTSPCWMNYLYQIFDPFMAESQLDVACNWYYSHPYCPRVLNELNATYLCLYRMHLRPESMYYCYVTWKPAVKICGTQ